MPFNADDYTKAPWTNGCMSLTHDEVVKVQDECKIVEEEFTPDAYNPIISDFWVISRYNESNNYEEAVNGDTYNVIKSYNRDFNTQGIEADEFGNGYIVPEPVIEEPEEETPTEGETVQEEETPATNETEAPADDAAQTEEEAPVEEAATEEEEAAPTEEV